MSVLHFRSDILPSMEAKLRPHQVEEENTAVVDLEDFEIVEHDHGHHVEHEQAHAVAISAIGCDAMMKEEPSWLNQRKFSDSNLEPFFDHFAGMINHTNLQAILGEQDHM